MIHKLIVIIAILIMSFNTWAETPEECLKKHEGSVCIFVNPTPYKTEIKGFNIERIAINKSATKVYVKTIECDDDVILPITNMTRGGSLLMILTLENGALLAVTEDFDVMYQDKNGKGALFKYDQERTLEYHKISKSD